MSVMSPLPVNPHPIMHMSSTEEPDWRGILPEGKTLEKVLKVMSEIFTMALQASDTRLKLKDLSVEDLYKLSAQKQSVKSREGLVGALLGGAGGLATIFSGLGFVAAPVLQQLHHGITPDAVQKTAEGIALFCKTGKDTHEAYQNGRLAEIDTRYSIEQGVSLQAAQQSYMALHSFIQKVQELAVQILSSQSRASGG